MPWKPSEPGEIPTLGYDAIDWITTYLAAPDRRDYEPFVPYREQEDFILRWYAIDPGTGLFLYRRGLLGRPRGWGKSPILAALACLEALAPIYPDGWDADGQPVGKPWSYVRTPNVHIAAVSEEQTKNTWDPLLEMLREGPVIDEYPGVEPLDTMVNLPKGQILQRTASARTIKGAKPVFSVLDQTEEWVPSNGGVKLAGTMRSNAAKIGGRTLESPNAYIPGENSVAESSAAFAASIREGRAKDEGLLYDHREAPPETSLEERETPEFFDEDEDEFIGLVDGLRVSYGDSSAHPGGCVIHTPPCPPGHVELDPLIATIWDPAQDVQMSRSDFLNQITHASDSWVSQPELTSSMDLDKVVDEGDVVVLGFDGSKGRARGKADATALIGCRVEDGHMFEIKVWEQPDGPDGKTWQPNPIEVNEQVRKAFEIYKVVGFYADPSGWTEHVARWEAKYGRRLKVKASQANPISAWPRGKTTMVGEYVERMRQAIVNRELTHDGSSALTRHILNARKRPTRSGYLIHKAYPDSPDKIDAAYAGVMAWKARLDAVAAGIGKKREKRVRRMGVMS
ncbi:hypothetical protein CH298_02705 [Rhodococcoides fascians]|uniref:hypothetical protein n=1 Tax=Rhodococcoides fascians TaxID=1828 RepID=UPI000B9C6ACB|nr:hypothetical protein [Rhodococcus fascians]OZE92463.1 hypothetical protein CH303_02705 [Rhodococcus fascians]OZF23096.1 hypothetical protein CH298_02705 [Rhodococcus fascians]OZF24810.1 hypothetical protein CH297_02705 [Rhodococcus fascians]OZF72405.1 hypothetical protein CH308_02710 [Rhodococcus fascians]OZF73703.1 hypothetical protein CH307_02705 [Rhodococcus fascians]